MEDVVFESSKPCSLQLLRQKCGPYQTFHMEPDLICRPTFWNIGVPDCPLFIRHSMEIEEHESQKTKNNI